MGKSLAQTLPFKSVNAESKQKLNFFTLGGARNLNPTKLGIMVEKVRTIYTPSKH